MYLFVALSQVGMQLVAEWHRFQLKKANPFNEDSGLNKLVKFTGKKMVEYIYIQNCIGRKGAFYQTSNKQDHFANTDPNLIQTNLT